MSKLNKTNIKQVNSVPFEVRKQVVLKCVFSDMSREDIGIELVKPIVGHSAQYSFFVGSILQAYNFFGRGDKYKRKPKAFREYYQQFSPDDIISFMDICPRKAEDLNGFSLFFEDVHSKNLGTSQFSEVVEEAQTMQSIDDYDIENQLVTSSDRGVYFYLNIGIYIIGIIFVILIGKHLMEIFSLLSTYTIFNR